MLFILCMIAGAIIAYLGVKSCAAILNSGEKNIKFISIVSFSIILLGVWIFMNAMEVYFYIVHNGLMNLFF